MAHLNLEEFEDCITVLVDGGAPEKLRDRLCQLNAFHSRRGLSTAKAISARLYQLSSGLRREVPSTQAFQALWADFIGTRLTEAAGEKLDELADKINENLEESGEIKEGCREQLEKALVAYEDVLARKVGGLPARLDTLQKAYPDVAAILRASAVPDVPIDAPEEGEDD